jgi:DNA-binding transcriptional MerR regulator
MSATGDGSLTIGELAERVGVATSTLRYYDEIGLVPPAVRASGRRRYAVSAVAEVGAILFFREVGFTLAEIGVLLADGDRRSRQDVVERKLAEVTAQRHRLDVAAAVLEHGRHCPAGDPMACPRFWEIIDGHLQGHSVEESHAMAHRRSSPS